jgi:deoxyribodipyrimidine photolyase
VYTYDPRNFAHSNYGMPKTGPLRAAFLQECVGELKQQLQGVGSDLLVAVGRPEEVIAGESAFYDRPKQMCFRPCTFQNCLDQKGLAGLKAAAENSRKRLTQ